ncbi:16S rRNA (guanine(527)-N(7))-methyltransferase RsmG [Arcticibacterium luteifluviistationis]|uniref:Ribosomal RNA small subunit methyltransferase G n=1 Tax=Arcticibacterium luteifluviistationis TaxID=1784714 RepID=A0A2Z4GHF3_9BACT|nr:16S rRNA (guanine(527)-N(7))-methyltransferase RsmG [Arcticibacterium luteifluviistationis]AWW00234.1 16S rRNA (guanine(527)-N(7))-methyltransferase RsmG [Arcticibacterium luteifluviistationis]
MDIILKYFPDLTEKQKGEFAQLLDLYTLWNSQINVISRKDVDALYEKHVLHSLGIAKVYQFAPNSKVLDVGTGGGFPGIPLAIMFPEVQFHLVDSIGKKIKVVNEVAEALGLKNVTAQHERAENVKGKYDFIVSRAVTRMKPFIAWIHQKFESRSINSLDNGILYLKGGDLEEELNEAKCPYQEHLLADFFEEEFFETKKVIYVPFS